MARGYIPMVGAQAPLINTSAQLLHITQHSLFSAQCKILRQFAELLHITTQHNLQGF